MAQNRSAKTSVAKLFKNGASQAVRLPAEFRFEGKEVLISRDAATGNVILSQPPGPDALAEFFRFQREMADSDVLDDFMKERPMNRIPVDRDIFHLDEES